MKDKLSPEVTELGKEIIPSELIGKNAAYQILRQPKRVAYPNGDEARYSDDYLLTVNRVYPFNEVIGSHAEGISQGEWKDLNKFTMGSPLQSSEGEHVLNSVLYTSAHAKLWQPKIIDVGKLTDTNIRTAEEYLDNIRRISPSYDKGRIDGGTIFGISVAQRAGFVLVAGHENKVIVTPSQRFIEYCIVQNRQSPTAS